MIKFLLLNFIATILLTGCSKEKPVYVINRVNVAPVIQNVYDVSGKYGKCTYLHHYYGEPPEDTLDFSAYFMAAHDDRYLYFLIHVYDQVKYFHPKPEDIIDEPLWNLSDYDRVNLVFDSDDDGIIDVYKNDIGVSINYGIDSVFTFNIGTKEIRFQQKDTEYGYIVQIDIPLKFLKKHITRFNIIITDHDNKFGQAGYDVFGRWESEFGWGVNRNLQDIKKRYGYLIIN